MFSEEFLKVLEEENTSIAHIARAMKKSPQAVGEVLRRGDLRESQMREYADKLGYDVVISLKSRNSSERVEAEKQLKQIANLMGYDAYIKISKTLK